MSAQTPFLVFSGTNSRYLAEKICNSLGCPLGQMNIQHFADGEFSVSYEESIRGRDVFLVQSTFPNSDNLMELLLMIDAAKRASAHSIIAVVPYFGWARQDRKDKPRVSIGAKLIADMLSTAGINRLITMDLHGIRSKDSLMFRWITYMLLPYSWIISRRLCLWITCVSRLRMLVVRNVPAAILSI